jgi:iron(III) transport system substrate-binding protein
MHQILMLYGWDLMTKIINNTTFVTSSKLAYQNVAKGEFPVGLTSEFNILVSKLEGFPVEAIYPSDGTALIIDANGIIKSGPNPDNAKKFLDFISSKQAHSILVEVDKRRSARLDTAPPPGLTAAKDIKSFAYDSLGAATQRKASLERFDKIFASK